jgi:hypothetical protein
MEHLSRLVNSFTPEKPFPQSQPPIEYELGTISATAKSPTINQVPKTNHSAPKGRHGANPSLMPVRTLPPIIHPTTSEVIQGRPTTTYLCAVLDYRNNHRKRSSRSERSEHRHSEPREHSDCEVVLADPPNSSVDRKSLLLTYLLHLWQSIEPQSTIAAYALDPRNEDRAGLHEDIIETFDIIWAARRRFGNLSTILNSRGGARMEGDVSPDMVDVGVIASSAELILTRLKTRLLAVGFDQIEVIDFLGQLRGVLSVIWKDEELEDFKAVDSLCSIDLGWVEQQQGRPPTTTGFGRRIGAQVGDRLSRWFAAL